MKEVRRPLLAALFTFAVITAAACGGSASGSGSAGTNSSNSGGSKNSGGSGGSVNVGGSVNLDPSVPMPKGFPTDFPVYSGARLTEAANFAASGGVSTFEMVWETKDSTDKVKTFYDDKLANGDWTITFSGSSNGSFSWTFARKSNDKASGILAVDDTSKQGITTITLGYNSGS